MARPRRYSRAAPTDLAHAIRTMQVVPLRLPFAVAVEHLHAVVLAVGDIEPALRIAADIMRDVELAGIGAGLTPGAQEFTVDGEFMDARIAVAVRDVEMVALRRQRRMRTAVKRLAAHKGRRLSRNPDRQQDAAVEGAAAHRVIAVIGQPDRVVGRHVDAMGPGEDALAPGAQQIASLIEDRDRVIAAIEGVDIVLAVDPDCGAIAEHDLIGYLGPALLDLETPLAAAEPLRHRRLPFVAPCHHRRGPARQARASVFANLASRREPRPIVRRTSD